MKTKLPLLLLSIMTTLSGFAQAGKNISVIDKSVQDIKNELPVYQKTEKINTADGSRYVFLKDNALKLITVKATEPAIEKNVAWYYINDQLAFSETSWYTTKTKEKIFSEKFYLNNGQLLAWINEEGRPMDAFSDEFRKTETLLIAYGIKIKEEALK